MRYWWVNQNQTFDQEIDGGYLWSPKRKANDQRNPFYEFMREVSAGDVIFSFARTRIAAIGIAQSTAFESPKPIAFGTAGGNWSNIGWKVAVRFYRLQNKIRPSEHMHLLRPLFPQRYAPLQINGRGKQSVYLTELPMAMAKALTDLIGKEARDFIKARRVDDKVRIGDTQPEILEWEDYLVKELENDLSLADTERRSLVLARRGQGEFKRNVQKIERYCRVTRVDRPEHLIASHCKPWRDCQSASERLDGENGLLLTPSVDHLFDRGLISFENSGELLVSPVAHGDSLLRMGVPVDQKFNVGPFSGGQRAYLEFHRDRVFLAASVERSE